MFSKRSSAAKKVTPLKIGISARLFHPEKDSTGIYSKTLHYLEQSVAHWVMSRDVMVFMVPTIDKDGLIHRSNIRLSDYAAHLDGLVLQGGADIAPQSYGEEPLQPDWRGDRTRDVYEMELLHEFMEADKPVLGICRGAQMINVALGGTLYQDIGTQLPGAIEHRNADHYDNAAHNVMFEPGSRLAKLYPNLTQARINTIHHQAVKSLGKGLLAEAWSDPDRVIEAIRLAGETYVFGVQWHPEFYLPGKEDQLDPTPILDEFLGEVKKRLH